MLRYLPYKVTTIMFILSINVSYTNVNLNGSVVFLGDTFLNFSFCAPHRQQKLYFVLLFTRVKTAVKNSLYHVKCCTTFPNNFALRTHTTCNCIMNWVNGICDKIYNVRHSFNLPETFLTVTSVV